MPMKRFFLLLAMALPLSLAAQEAPKGIPADVYYLMPQFSPGYIFFRGQMPAQGKLNICAVDNTLRFIDKDGKELAAMDEANIVRVRIDTVTFLRSDGLYYRLYPVQTDWGIAVLRKVRIIRDQKEAGYGGTTQTSAVREYGAIYSEGAIHQFDSDKVYPYESSEDLFLYRGETAFPLSKRNVKKLFPSRKADIDAWFKQGGSLPETLDGLREFLALWY